MSLTRTVVTVRGCDDSTTAVVWLTDEEAAGVRKVRDRINGNSSVSCMPTMRVGTATAADVSEDARQAAEAEEDEYL